MKILSEALDYILRVFIPLFYVYCWYAIPVYLLGKENIDVMALIVTALPVMFIGVISKQTSWSIGGNKGIKGDNIGKRVKASIDRRGSFELQGIDMDEKKVEEVIEAVAKNPVFTDKTPR